tara:strand:+ start:387 stop:791 length:405 start_codon:yes stop_codon:yes gene_type:complete
MNKWQKIINVCLAVIVTLLIFQNQQLKDQVDSVLFDQILNKDVLSMRIDKNEADLSSYYRTQSKDNTLYELGELVSKIQKLDDKQDRDINELNRNVKDLKANNRNFNRNVLKIVGDKCDVSGFGNYWDFACNRK